MSNQLDIFSVRSGYTDFCDWFPPEDQDPDGLRWYQREAFNSNLAAFADGKQVVLNVLATGLGKTTLFSAHAKNWPGNVLVLAHRDELVSQAAERLQLMTGERVDREQADDKSLPKTRLVVGSVQSVSRKTRLERLGKKRFDLIVIDEGHHALSASYRKIIDFFACPKLLVTATPDRGDKKALGQIVDHVGYKFDISEGIDAGYLVPIRGESVRVDQIDLSAVSTSAGDLVQAALENAMVKAVEGIVYETMQRYPHRRAIAFFPGIKSAEYACEKFNAIAPNSTCFISGSTPPEERAYLVHAFKTGKFTRLCNCDIATEGFDAPSTDLVIMASPTLSRSKYCQRAGRGTRVLPGVVDGFTRKEEAHERRAAISRSAKPHLLLLDFVGDPGRHSLVSPVDVLGGEYTESELTLAKEKAKSAPGADQRALLEAARAELLAIAKSVKTVKSTSRVASFDPFSCIGAERPSATTRFKDHDRPSTPAQRERIANRVKKAMSAEAIAALTFKDAQELIAHLGARSANGLCTMSQAKMLAKYGISHDITFERASQCMAYLASLDFGRRGKIDPVRLNRLAYGQRQPGED